MNRFIIADASKCIGCHTCEVARMVSRQENQGCASLTSEIFLPRTHVIKGVSIPTATVCRQCEDAPCVNVCPNGAISRDKESVHVIQECYIGYRTCAVACPYGVMGAVVRPVIRNSGAGLNMQAGKAEANKCDLCNHREDDSACMAACPTHALICVDRNKLERLSAEKRRRTMLMFQKSYKTILVSKEFPEIFVECGVGGIVDLRLPDMTQSCSAGRATQFMTVGITQWQKTHLVVPNCVSEAKCRASVFVRLSGSWHSN